jgi:hypothetical protein
VRKSVLLVLALAFAVVALVACADARSPSKVCDRIGSLVKGAKDVPALSHEACVEQLEEMRKGDRAAYECTADCVLKASAADGAVDCLSRCKAHGSAFPHD